MEKRWKFMGEWVFKYLIKRMPVNTNMCIQATHIDENYTFDLSAKFCYNNSGNLNSKIRKLALI